MHKPNLDAQYLHLGCGLQAPENWLNLDGSFQATFARLPRLKQLLAGIGIYPRSQAAINWPANVLRLNLRRRLPFPSNRFSAIYSSHTFEHLFRDEAGSLAAECFRVLRPGGICRIVVPDLKAAIARYCERSTKEKALPDVELPANRFMDELLAHPRSPTPGLIGLYHRFMNIHQHKWMYDGTSLSKLLTSAGFTAARIYRTSEGQLPGLAEIENPTRIENGAGVAVEVIKS